jgi:galactokinase
LTLVVERLIGAGLSPAEAERKGRLFEAAERRLAEATGGESQVARWFVPGRIEVLGKHTDYAGGRSLLCAVERGFCLVARPRADAVVRIADAVLGVETRLALSGTSDAGDDGGWTVYPAAVVRRIARNFPGALRGADIVFASDLPRSAGLSSSSALVVAVFMALAASNALEEREEYRTGLSRPEDLAGYLGAVENGLSFGPLAGDLGVGTFGGSEDHTAILCCRAARLAQYAFCPVRFERDAELPAGWTFVVGASGVAAEKAGGARESYNRLSLAAAAIFELGRSAGVPGNTLGEAAGEPGAPERIREVLASSSHPRFSTRVLIDRFNQFVEESEVLVPEAAKAFARGDAGALGEVIARSQAGAERLLRNQIPETTSLVASARSLGAIAASAFGAGFGGSVWALVPAGEAGDFRASWEGDYRRHFPAVAGSSEFFVTGAGPGLVRLEEGRLAPDFPGGR